MEDSALIDSKVTDVTPKAVRKRRVRGSVPVIAANMMAKRDQLKAAILASVNVYDVREIVIKAVADAKRGDRYARDWLFDRLLGKSVTYNEVTVENKALTDAEARATLDKLLKLDVDPKDAAVDSGVK